MSVKRAKHFYRQIGPLVIILLTFLLLLPLPLVVKTDQSRVAYVILVMGIFWATEVLPISVTSLLPVILFPALDIMPAKRVSALYFKDTTMLFTGGLIVAVAFEKWRVHERLALTVLLRIGKSPRSLLYTFMGVTCFLSMWLSNTATTAMMTPIAHSILQTLRSVDDRFEEEGVEGSGEVVESPGDREGVKGGSDGVVGSSFPLVEEDRRPSPEGKIKPAPPPHPNFSHSPIPSPTPLDKMLMLSICYSANIGGMATLTGTATNLVFKGQLDAHYSGHPVSFATWFFFASPLVALNLVVAAFCLEIRWMGWRSLLTLGKGSCGRSCWGCCGTPCVAVGGCSCCRSCRNCRRCRSSPTGSSAADAAFAEFRRRHASLGAMSFAEISVSALFALLALAWLFRDPGFCRGWAALLGAAEPGRISDATVALFFAVALFVVPSRNVFVELFRRGGDDNNNNEEDVLNSSPAFEPLLDWETAVKGVPWGVLLLLGSGFALAEGCQASCLSATIAAALSDFAAAPDFVFVALLVLIGAASTEFTTNTSTLTILFPILAAIGESLSINPLKILLPVTLSTSFAFMLPVATPPNAIVFSYGQLNIRDMMTTGLAMNLLSIVTVLFCVFTWGTAMFSLDEVPDWATLSKNITDSNRC